MADSLIAQLVPTSVGSITLTILLTAIGYQAAIYIYNIFFHPLRSFPGPVSCAASAIPKVRQDFSGHGISWMIQLHEKYGEVVRITPNELSFSGADAYKDIHGFTNSKAGFTTLEKDQKFYMVDLAAKAHSVINAPGPEHGRQRKIFANAFSDRALKLQEPLFLTYIDKLVSKLRESPGTKRDMVRLYNYTAFDIIADLTFGESLGMLDNLDYHPWVASMLASFRFGVYHHCLNYWPAIKTMLMRYCIPKSLIASKKVQDEFARLRVEARLEKEDARPDIWGLVLEKNQSNVISRPEMYLNAGLFMLAGTETTATALSGLTWLLLSHPDKLNRLIHEIRDAFVDEDEITVERLQALPYLNGCVEEGLRMYPPVPIGLPRKCPQDRSTLIDGHEVPAEVSLPHQLSNHDCIMI